MQELNKKSIAAKARIANKGEDYMSRLAHLRHSKATKEQRSALGRKLNEARWGKKNKTYATLKVSAAKSV